MEKILGHRMEGENVPVPFLLPARTEDTGYKRELVEIYNDYFSKLKDPWTAQTEGFPKAPKKVQFELVTQSDWQSEVNRMFA